MTEHTTAVDFQDTVALLQEEIARLEEELRLREEAAAGVPSPSGERGVDEEAEGRRREAAARAASELAERDETIGLLLEQVQRLEAAEAAGRAEWEQLHEWLREVERRVEGHDGRGEDLARALDDERRRHDATRREADVQRRSWETSRRAAEDEAEQLRGRLAELATRDAAGPGAAAALAALEDENRRLRQARDELARQAAAAAEALRAELDAARDRVAELERRVRHAEDEAEARRREHEAELAAARVDQARAALDRPARPADGELSPDERIRALRLHLREIHERERQRREQGTLSARLGRLWRRTGPASA